MFRNARSKSRQRGSILILTLLVTPLVLFPIVGLAIDVTMLRIVQARLSASVDGAVLGAGRLLGTTADPQLIAKEFVNANFLTNGTAGFFGATNLQITTTYTPGITKTISVNATADVPLLFIRVIGKTKSTVTAAGTATRTDSRVMLVVDRSGSMSTVQGDGNQAIVDAINDAVEFTDSWNAGTDEVGLVVFDGSAYVAYPPYAPGTYSATPGNSGGPDTGFNTFVSPATAGPMVVSLQNTKSNNGSTNTSEALWLAYVELQKAHLRDTSGGGVDTRINAIVLMTDGVPQSVTVYPNNYNSYPANYFMNTAANSSCTNLYNAATKPKPNPMIGFMIVPSAQSGGSSFNSQAPLSATGQTPTSNNGKGLYQLASTDNVAAHNSAWWVNQGAGQALIMESGNDVNCTEMFGVSGVGTNGKDLAKIPSTDYYGNNMISGNYTNSVFVNGAGTVLAANADPILGNPAHTFLQTNVNGGIDWVQAQWNAADSAGQRIRSDANLVNRPGDIKMPIYIYTIGFLGDGGCDQGLLLRIANDPTSATYDNTTLPGKYYPAANTAALHDAFETVVATILRLAK